MEYKEILQAMIDGKQIQDTSDDNYGYSDVDNVFVLNILSKGGGKFLRVKPEPSDEYLDAINTAYKIQDTSDDNYGYSDVDNVFVLNILSKGGGKFLRVKPEPSDEYLDAINTAYKITMTTYTNSCGDSRAAITCFMDLILTFPIFKGGK